MNFSFFKVFLIFCFFVFSLSLDGQHFRAGAKGGLTATKISGDRDPDGGRPRLGMYASIFTNYPVSEKSHWQLELMYIQKGSRAYMSGIEPDEEYRDYKLDLHYVEIPIIYNYYLSDISSIDYIDRLTIEAGLSFASVIGHYEEKNGSDITNREAEAKPFNWGELNAIAGLYYPMFENLEFHFRFSQGVTPVRPHGTEGGASGTWWQWINQFGQYNTAFSVGLSYTLFLRPATL